MIEVVMKKEDLVKALIDLTVQEKLGFPDSVAILVLQQDKGSNITDDRVYYTNKTIPIVDQRIPNLYFSRQPSKPNCKFKDGKLVSLDGLDRELVEEYHKELEDKIQKVLNERSSIL